MGTLIDWSNGDGEPVRSATRNVRCWVCGKDNLGIYIPAERNLRTYRPCAAIDSQLVRCSLPAHHEAGKHLWR